MTLPAMDRLISFVAGNCKEPAELRANPSGKFCLTMFAARLAALSAGVSASKVRSATWHVANDAVVAHCANGWVRRYGQTVSVSLDEFESLLRQYFGGKIDFPKQPFSASEWDRFAQRLAKLQSTKDAARVVPLHSDPRIGGSWGGNFAF